MVGWQLAGPAGVELGVFPYTESGRKEAFHRVLQPSRAAAGLLCLQQPPPPAPEGGQETASQDGVIPNPVLLLYALSLGKGQS